MPNQVSSARSWKLSIAAIRPSSPSVSSSIAIGANRCSPGSRRNSAKPTCPEARTGTRRQALGASGRAAKKPIAARPRNQLGRGGIVSVASAASSVTIVSTSPSSHART